VILRLLCLEERIVLAIAEASSCTSLGRKSFSPTLATILSHASRGPSSLPAKSESALRYSYFEFDPAIPLDDLSCGVTRMLPM
jgi:hypothetical protein